MAKRATVSLFMTRSNVMGSEAGMREKPDMAMYYKPVDRHLPFTLIRGGEGQERTRFVCGYLGCDARPFNPLLAALPPMLRVEQTERRRPVGDRPVRHAA